MPPKDKSYIGIVLAGGLSTRMHMDKSQLLIENSPLYKLAAEKIAPFCDNIYISINNYQFVSYRYEYPAIQDIYPSQGPIGGILSCFDKLKSSMIVLACDMPYIDVGDIDLLLSLHTGSQVCTMFFNKKNGYYDPLLSVWEGDKLYNLKTFFEDGGRSLQQFLNENNIAKHPHPHPSHFKNINTPEVWAEIKANGFNSSG